MDSLSEGSWTWYTENGVDRAAYLHFSDRMEERYNIKVTREMYLSMKHAIARMENVIQLYSAHAEGFWGVLIGDIPVIVYLKGWQLVTAYPLDYGYKMRVVMSTDPRVTSTAQFQELVAKALGHGS